MKKKIEIETNNTDCCVLGRIRNEWVMWWLVVLFEHISRCQVRARNYYLSAMNLQWKTIRNFKLLTLCEVIDNSIQNACSTKLWRWNFIEISEINRDLKWATTPKTNCHAIHLNFHTQNHFNNKNNEIMTIIKWHDRWRYRLCNPFAHRSQPM